MAKETGQYAALGVDLSSHIWKLRQLTKMRAESRSYEFEPKPKK